MLYVWEDLPAKLQQIDKTNKGFFIDLNVVHTKWLITYLYNPNISNIYSNLESPS